MLCCVVDVISQWSKQKNKLTFARLSKDCISFPHPLVSVKVFRGEQKGVSMVSKFLEIGYV